MAGITFLLIAAFTLTVGTIDPAALGGGPIDPELARREALAAPLGTGFIVVMIVTLAMGR